MRVVGSRRSCVRPALRALVSGAAVFLLGCHHSTIYPPGTPIVTMGETSGEDFASYIVSVDSITFTRNDGNVVSVLGVPQTIDLARLSDMTELVEAPAVPEGTYTSATLALDYTVASVWVPVNGTPVLATLTTPADEVPTTTVVTVTFDPNHPLVITQGVANRVQIDIDLAASNTITTSGSTATVSVQPFVVITPAPADATVMRARGLFVTAPSGKSYYIMNVRPFYNLVSALGALFVNIDSQTYFNINGVTYTGAAGLTALSQLTENTAVAAYGTLGDLANITPSFTATAVYGGTSLESPLADYITGVVSSRVGDTLEVIGGTYLTPTGTTSFFANLPVLVGSGTLVSEDGVAAGGLTVDSISAGQQINVSGQPVVNSAGALTSLDATAGQVRLQSTRLWGTLNSASAGSASLDVLSIENYPISAFYFAGAAAGGRAANPAAYVLDTGALNESAVAPGTLLQVDGVATPFGSAPPDFTVSAITPGSATQQELVIEWNSGASQPFTSVDAAGIVIDAKNADLGTTHYIRTGSVKVDLDTLPHYPVITTVGADQSNLQLAIGSTGLTTGISVYNEPDGFADAVSKDLDGGSNVIYRLIASGQYDSASNTFIASRIHVALYE